MDGQSPASFLALRRKFIAIRPLTSRLLVSDVDVSPKATRVNPGELFEEICVVDDKRAGMEQLSLISMERKDVLLECSIIDLREVGNFGADVLLPVQDYKTRIKFLEGNGLAYATGCRVGSSVTVRMLDICYPAIIRYIGPLSGNKNGTYFGIRLPFHPGHGDCDGSYNGVRYFRCKPGSGIFVTVECISPATGNPGLHEDQAGTAALEPPSLAIPQSAPLDALHGSIIPLDSRVYYYDDGGRQLIGTVRWIGFLNGTALKSEIHAGLELDDRLGEGTGVFNNVQLYVTAPGFACFVPLSYLTKLPDKVKQEAYSEKRNSSPKVQAETIEEQRVEECVVCLSARPTMAFIPCGHKHMCNKCARDVFERKDRHCPACRRVPTSMIRIFD